MKTQTTTTPVRFNYYTLNAEGKKCPKCGGSRIGYDWNMTTGAAQALCETTSCHHSYDPTTRQPITRK